MTSTASDTKRKPFSPEFRAEAIKLANELGQVISKLAKNLNIKQTTLRAWIKQNEVD